MSYKLNYSSGNHMVREEKDNTLRCPDCNSKNITDGRKCQECGEPTRYLTCHVCSSQTYETNICVNCGNEWRAE